MDHDDIPLPHSAPPPRPSAREGVPAEQQYPPAPQPPYPGAQQSSAPIPPHLPAQPPYAPAEPPYGAAFETPPPPVPKRRVRRGVVIAWVAASLVVVALGAGAAWFHVSAHRSHDAAAAAVIRAVDNSETAAAGLEEATEESTRAIDAASVISEAAADGTVDAAARTAFVDAAAQLTTTRDEADALLSEPIGPFDIEKPTWPWELIESTSALDADAVEVRATADEMTILEGDASAAEDALAEAAVALYASVPAAASALEAANVSAKTGPVLDLREHAAAVAEQDKIGPGTASAFALYAQSAKDIVLSAQGELAEKQGPLYDTRLEIEAFARSISGGVVLDFDWAPIVNGYGGRSGMGGLATWDASRGGFSTITLSDSVAENWPDPDARALVAHEVGHSITSKCYQLIDWESSPANEEWATAWAISMGHTAEGNGVQAYGYPSQAMIDLAATCR